MILVDHRAGSGSQGPQSKRPPLLDYIEPRSLVQVGEYDADVCFLGRGYDEEPIPIGIEYKRIDDVLKCIHDGRFSGIQLPRMIEVYGSGRMYLLIEGAYRLDPTTGILELQRWDPVARRVGWRPAQYGRDAWLYRQLDNWINTMTEMVSLRVWRTWSVEESAGWIKDLYVWWTSKAYEDHRAHLKWASPDARLETARRKHNLLVPQDTTKLSLIQQWAARCPTIGPDKSVLVANHFRSARRMATATKAEWQEIAGIGRRGAELIVAEIEKES